MTWHRRRILLAGASANALALAGCATPGAQPFEATTTRTVWSGRLSLRVESQPPQSFIAGFELRGNAQSGELLLFSAFGATLAQLNWSPGQARLQAQGRTETFASIADLTLATTGAELPVGSLFRWLIGQPADEGGWHADLAHLAQGKLNATRLAPAPPVELRILLE